MVNYRHATSEQVRLAMDARKIAEENLLPRIEEYENADGGLGKYPLDVHYKMAQAGYYAMNIPKEWGGRGYDVVTEGVIMNEIAKVDAGFAMGLHNSGSYFHFVNDTSMSHEDKQMWADRFLRGDAIGAFCVTEPDAGSDAAAMRTNAYKDGDEWVINGTKCFISMASVANFFVVAAWTDRTKRVSQGVTFFFVEKERGVQIGKKENKMGLHLNETAEVIFEDVRVPADHVIGEEGRGFVISMKEISTEGRTLGAAFALGIAESALEHVTEFAKTTRKDGKRLIDYQSVGFRLADMYARTEACRSMIYEGLTCLRDGISTGYMPNMIKMYNSDCAMQTTLDAMHIYGEYGYRGDCPIERLVRNAKIFQIFSGTNEIQHKNTMQAIAGKDPLRKK